MSGNQTVFVASLAVAALILLLVVIRRQGWGSPIIYLSLVYLYLTFGSVATYLMGGEIYFGIREEFIADAAVIFLLGQVGLMLGAVVVGHRRNYNMRKHDDSIQIVGTLLPWIVIALLCVTIGMVAVLITSSGGLGKTGTIDLIGGELHYPLMLLHKCALSLYFVMRRQLAYLWLYSSNFVAYVGYCLMTNERDFLFIIFTIVVLKVMIGETKFGAKAIMIGIGAVIIGSVLGVVRSSDGELSLFSVLGANSILFINTNILFLVPDEEPFRMGGTYVASVWSLLPSFLRGDTLQTLTGWFKDWFAPGGRSTYGFALDAEAYLNFGYWGVPVVFCVLGMSLLWVSNRFDRHPFYSYATVYLLASLMYSVRNESWTLIHGCAYAAVFFLVALTRVKSATYGVGKRTYAPAAASRGTTEGATKWELRPDEM